MNTEPLWKLFSNDQPIYPKTALPIRPGLANRLKLVSPSDAPEVGVTLIRTLPQGQRLILETSLKPDAACVFDLGPMTAPPHYEFEAGTVYQIGYRIELLLKDAANARVLFRCDWAQGRSSEAKPWRIFPQKPAPTIEAGREEFISGGAPRRIYNPKVAVEATLDLRLDPQVLTDQDQVRAVFRLNQGALVEELSAGLCATNGLGQRIFDQTVQVHRTPAGDSLFLPVRDWPEGDFLIALYPVIDGRIWEEGPMVRYRRRTPCRGRFPVSPFAPWTLDRDTARESWVIEDLQTYCEQQKISLPPEWAFAPSEQGSALVSCSKGLPTPVEFSPSVDGLYAVFATPHGHGCYLQNSVNKLIRACPGPQVSNENNAALATEFGPEIFVDLVDFSKATLFLHGFPNQDGKVAGLAGLRFEPVTAASAKTFLEATRNPSTPLTGVNDWGGYFHDRKDWLASRMERASYDMIFAGQAELGIQSMDWSLGRSGVQYRSKHPDLPMIPLGPDGLDPLEEALRCGTRYGQAVNGWMALMDYGKSKSELRNRMFQAHPEFRRWRKNASGPDEGEPAGQLLSLYFPEIRRDKVRIFLEAAERGVASLLVCSVRLAPLMDYHPEKVAAYRRTFEVDPLTLTDAASPAYRHWIRWRADFFTELLRELRAGLGEIEKARGGRIPVGVRMSTAGLDYNLAQGLNVEQWLMEGLVDRLQMAALEDRGGPECNPHDIRPYLDLGRRYGVPVWGGLGATWTRSAEALPVCLRRARGLLAAGVDGLELYESEHLARGSRHRWVAPLFGTRSAIETFLAESNLDACYPVSARTALYGYDNHSRWFIEGPWVWQWGGTGEDAL